MFILLVLIYFIQTVKKYLILFLPFPQYFIMRSPMDKNDGSTEDRQGHIEYVNALKTKWGKYYDYDWKHNKSKIKIPR